MRKIMAVHPDMDMLDEMDDLLTERFPRDVIMDKVRNEAEARIRWQEAESAYQAIIVNHSIAPDVRTARNEAEDRGLTFLESFEALGLGDIPKILIAPAATVKILSRKYALRRCRLGRVLVGVHAVGRQPVRDVKVAEAFDVRKNLVGAGARGGAGGCKGIADKNQAGLPVTAALV